MQRQTRQKRSRSDDDRQEPRSALDRHRFAPLVEPLRQLPSFVSRAMFGSVGCYVGGRIVLVLSDRAEPWQGLLVPTEKRRHDALRRAFPELTVHPVLPKWLYLASRVGGFTDVATALVERIAAGDAAIGVEPKVRLPRRARRG
jgi:hypothetical protein